MQSNKTKSSLNNQESHTQDSPKASTIFLKATLLSIVFACFLLLLTALGIVAFGYYKLSVFAKQANTPVPEITTLVSTAFQTTPKQTNEYKTILLLGLDTVANKPNSPQLTDTMLLISVHMPTGSINTLSLPRDLWSQDYKTRINALYEYGKERYPERPEQFSEEVVMALTGVTIDHTIPLSLQSVAEIIDILGGIDVMVSEGFVDSQFPREDINILSATSTADLYETIKFETGLQHMDGKRTLQYIRSRKSTDIIQGTDTARSKRQQEVLSAMLTKIQSFSILNNTDVLAQLFILYNTTFENKFSKLEALATLKALYPLKDNISLHPHTLSIFPDSENGSITNPPISKYAGQWVYEITNINAFQQEVQRSLRMQ